MARSLLSLGEFAGNWGRTGALETRGAGGTATVSTAGSAVGSTAVALTDCVASGCDVRCAARFGVAQRTPSCRGADCRSCCAICCGGLCAFGFVRNDRSDFVFFDVNESKVGFDFEHFVVVADDGAVESFSVFELDFVSKRRASQGAEREQAQCAR